MPHSVDVKLSDFACVSGFSCLCSRRPRSAGSRGKRQPLEGALRTFGPVTDEAVLGVDIGTSSSKGVLVSRDGRLLATSVRHHAVEHPSPGQVEMDGELWWSEFAAISRELTAGNDVRVLAVGVSGIGPCVLLTDDDGTA